jgi:hypothetical protein
LEPVVADIGCGRGEVVRLLNNDGIEAFGIDQIDLSNGMLVGDITKPIDRAYKSAICIDVVEHIDDEALVGLIENMKKAEKQVLSTASMKSRATGPNGEKLHINIKTPEEWVAYLEEHFVIHDTVKYSADRWLHMMTTRG